MINHIQKTDYSLMPSATVGYVVLTYQDASGNLHTIVLVVPRS
jgi:hypothetical protein